MKLYERVPLLDMTSPQFKRMLTRLISVSILGFVYWHFVIPRGEQYQLAYWGFLLYWSLDGIIGELKELNRGGNDGRSGKREGSEGGRAPAD